MLMHSKHPLAAHISLKLGKGVILDRLEQTIKEMEDIATRLIKAMRDDEPNEKTIDGLRSSYNSYEFTFSQLLAAYDDKPDDQVSH